MKKLEELVISLTTAKIRCLRSLTENDPERIANKLGLLICRKKIGLAAFVVRIFFGVLGCDGILLLVNMICGNVSS